MPYSQKNAVLLLAFLKFLERFSYYGTRTIVVLFAIDVLEMESEYTLSLYGTFITVGFILPLFAGIISDAFFKQKKGILYGGIISLIGYLMLIPSNTLTLGIGLMLILLGTSFTKPNLTVLVGRLFEKTDKNRGFAFLVLYFIINIGAFLSILLVGYVGEKYGFKYGFMITAYAALKFLIIFYFTKDRFPLIEKDIENKHTETNKINDTILDSELTKNQQTDAKPIILIGIITLVAILFWQFSQISNARIQEYILSNPVISIGNFDMKDYFLQMIDGIFSLIISILLFLFWYFRGIGRTTLKFGIAMILLGVTSQVVANINLIPIGSLVPVLAVTFFTFSLAEILIHTFSLSYITRLSNTRYSSSIVGGFICLSWLGGNLLTLLIENIPFDNWINIFSIISILIGCLLFIFRKKLLHLSGGID